MQSEPSSGIKLTAYSCICWLFHRIYYDARNHKHKIRLYLTLKIFLYYLSNYVFAVTWCMLGQISEASYSHENKKKFISVYVRRRLLFEVQPSSSPDLNPLEFLPCGQFKTLLYSYSIEDEKMLHQPIVYASQAVINRSMTFEVVQQSMIRRVHAYFDPG